MRERTRCEVRGDGWRVNEWGEAQAACASHFRTTRKLISSMTLYDKCAAAAAERCCCARSRVEHRGIQKDKCEHSHHRRVAGPASVDPDHHIAALKGQPNVGSPHLLLGKRPRRASELRSLRSLLLPCVSPAQPSSSPASKLQASSQPAPTPTPAPSRFDLEHDLRWSHAVQARLRLPADAPTGMRACKARQTRRGSRCSSQLSKTRWLVAGGWWLVEWLLSSACVWCLVSCSV